MRMLLVAVLMITGFAAAAQNDKIHLHNGKKVEGTVVRVAEFTVVFKYANEDAEQTAGKYSVAKIIYGKSGREETISEKINVHSKEDWENVVILEDKSQVAGLIKADEIKGKTSFINYRTAAGSDKKSQQRLKEEAAAKGCAFVLLTSDKDMVMNSTDGASLGNTQSIKKGVAYKY